MWIPYATLLRDLFLRAKDEIWKPKGTPASLHGRLIRQPARVLFLCAKMLNGNQHIPRNLRTVDS